MYVCMYVSNATGMQLLPTYFLWEWHCFHACMCSRAKEHALTKESPAERWRQLGRLGAQQHGSSDSEERREYGGRLINHGEC